MRFIFPRKFPRRNYNKLIICLVARDHLPPPFTVHRIVVAAITIHQDQLPLFDYPRIIYRENYGLKY